MPHFSSLRLAAAVTALLALGAGSALAQPAPGADSAQASSSLESLESLESLDYQAARARMRQVSDQLAAAQAAVESRRLQKQGLQSLGGPMASVSAGLTRYSLRGDLDLGSAKQRLMHDMLQGSQGQPLTADASAALARLQQLGMSLPALPGSLPFHFKDSFSSQAVMAVWPVYTGGLTTAIQQLAGAQETEAQADATVTAHRLDTTLAQRYFGAQLAQQAARLRQQAVQAIAGHDQAAGRMLQVGLMARVERLQASAALEDARRQALKAQGEANLANMALQRLLDSPQPVALTSPLFVISVPIEPLAHFQQLARQHHPGFEKVAAKKAQAEQLHAAQNASWQPSVVAYGRRELGAQNPNWAAGVQASWTLWSPLDRRSMSAASAQKIIQAERTGAQIDSDIALLVERHWRAVEDARQQYLATGAGIDLAQEVVRLRTSGLREGTSTTMDLIDAQTGYVKLQTERAQAANDYVQALALLLESAGVPGQLALYMQRADVRIAP